MDNSKIPDRRQSDQGLLLGGLLGAYFLARRDFPTPPDKAQLSEIIRVQGIRSHVARTVAEAYARELAHLSAGLGRPWTRAQIVRNLRRYAQPRVFPARWRAVAGLVKARADSEMTRPTEIRRRLVLRHGWNLLTTFKEPGDPITLLGRYGSRLGDAIKADLESTATAADTTSLDELSEGLEDPDPGREQRKGIDHFLETAKGRRLLALADLPDAEKRVWMLRYVHGYDRQEIADMRETLPATVSVQLSRARSKVRAACEGLGLR